MDLTPNNFYGRNRAGIVVHSFMVGYTYSRDNNQVKEEMVGITRSLFGTEPTYGVCSRGIAK